MNIKNDKSPQGFVDPDIIPLLEILNEKYNTTSSCSGRITLLSGVKKGSVAWIFKSHTKVDATKVYQKIQEHEEETIRFFYEPLIIHLKCHSQDDAKEILKILHINGFRKSSIISLKKLLIEINDTGKMETILTKDLTLKYIELLVNEANKRLEKTKLHIKKLEELFAKE
jgi:tRNA(Phe) wybutosine-synthesizing methylase Tyw3